MYSLLLISNSVHEIFFNGSRTGESKTRLNFWQKAGIPPWESKRDTALISNAIRWRSSYGNRRILSPDHWPGSGTGWRIL